MHGVRHGRQSAWFDGIEAAFRQVRELVRLVQADCAIELDTNAYSVPWRLIGESVQVVVAAGRVSIRHAGVEVAAHAATCGRRPRVIDRKSVVEGKSVPVRVELGGRRIIKIKHTIILSTFYLTDI